MCAPYEGNALYVSVPYEGNALYVSVPYEGNALYVNADRDVVSRLSKRFTCLLW